MKPAIARSAALNILLMPLAALLQRQRREALRREMLAYEERLLRDFGISACDIDKAVLGLETL